MKIIIPASGIGKRFIDAGYKDTKPLINVTQNKKIIDYVFDMFNRENDEFFIVSSAATSNELEEHLSTSGINYKHIVLNESKAGPVGAILSASSELSKHITLIDEVIISYCDFGIEWDYSDFLRFLKETKPEACIPCYTGYHPHLEPEENVYACCKTDIDGNFETIIEKYKSNDKYNELWSPGVYYFKEFGTLLKSAIEMVEAKDSLNNEYYASLLYKYINKNEVSLYNKIPKFYQFGTPKDFEQVKVILNKKADLINDSSIIKNTIILSAGKGERFLNLSYKQPKPFIPLGKTDFITIIVNSFKNVDTNIMCIGSEDHKLFWENSQINNYKLITPNKIGAAFSYKEGCQHIEGETLIVPCDLIAKHVTPEFIKLKEDADVIIFTTDPSEYANNNKESFAWVNGENNLVKDISIKEAKTENNMVLIGSFWVKENKELIKNIDAVFNKEYTVNGEYYLDNAFKVMLDYGYNISYVKVDKYFSLGTPEEYNENKYWVEGQLDD